MDYDPYVELTQRVTNTFPANQGLPHRSDRAGLGGICLNCDLDD